MSREAPGKKPTLKDLAREAGVSLASASYAVNGNGSVGEQTRKHVLEVAARIGYRSNVAARATRTGRTGTLALVVPDMTNPFFPTLAQAIFRAARADGYGMFLVDTEGSEQLEREALSMITGLSVDGVFWFPIRDRDNSAGVLARTATVVLDRTVEGYDRVTVDYVEAGRIAARHLIDAGHRRIGIITGPGDVASMRDRCDGAEAVIRAEGDLAFRVENAFSLDLEPATKEALQAGEVTAVFAAADIIALGTIRHLQAQGVAVPDDISVLGFDDIPWADHSAPALSTVEIPIEAIAHQAMLFLLDRLKPDAAFEPRCHHVTARLVPRKSVRTR